MAPKKVASLADLVKQNKNPQAIRMAKAILGKDPRNVEAHYLLALALEQDGKAELAFMEMKTVSSFNDFKGYCKESEFRPRFARLFDQFNFPEEALKEYLLLIKMDPYNAEYYHRAGSLFEKRNKNTQAAQYYKKAIDLDPRNPEAHFALGTLLYKGKRVNDAKIILSKALKLHPDNYKAHFYLGRMHKEAKNYTSAIQSFEQAQKDSELKIKALVERGICFIAIHKIDKAETELQRAIALSEKTKAGETIFFARYYLAICHEKERHIDKAIEQWEAIYRERPAFKDVAEKLSQFQDLREDDRMKDYLTSNNQHFGEICQKVATLMNLVVSDQNIIPDGCQIIATEKTSGQWRNTKKQSLLLRFYRITENIDSHRVRIFYEEVQKLKAARGIMVTSSQFTRDAKAFTESRPMELVEKKKLQELLHKADS